MDVGQGDAALVELPGGAAVLVDTGPGGPGRFDVGERVLAPFLWNRPRRELAAVAISHPDPDHAGALATVLRRFRVAEVWDGILAGDEARAGDEDARRLLACSGARHRVLGTPMRLILGEATFTALHPDADPLPGTNENSLVLRLDWRAFSLLLTGDLGAPGEARLLARGEPLQATVLKVGHHGSRFSSTTPFLEAVRPAAAVISVGARNPFGHPTPQALDRLAGVGARVYRTDRDGAVLLETDGRSLWITRWASRRTERIELGRGERAALLAPLGEIHRIRSPRLRLRLTEPPTPPTGSPPDHRRVSAAPAKPALERGPPAALLRRTP
jgi:competence protein ComEC